MKTHDDQCGVRFIRMFNQTICFDLAQLKLHGLLSTSSYVLQTVIFNTLHTNSPERIIVNLTNVTEQCLYNRAVNDHYRGVGIGVPC